MKLSTVHPLEKLRKERGLSQTQLADLILYGKDVISLAENRKAVGRKVIDRLLDWSGQVGGRLKRSDFTERTKNGDKGKGRQARGGKRKVYKEAQARVTG